uniref:Uncharacterized protein n=1 Tax=Plectus sambesii TaxID=2011161 RepID=A0A914XTJ5_9BILA
MRTHSRASSLGEIRFGDSIRSTDGGYSHYSAHFTKPPCNYYRGKCDGSLMDAGLESNPWMQSLLKEARECSDRTRNESTQLKTMLDEHVRGRHEDGMENDMTDGNGKAESAAVMENQKGVRFDDVQPTCSSDRRALKELDQALRAQGVVEGSALLPTKELDNYFKEAQRWEKRDKLNEP